MIQKWCTTTCRAIEDYLGSEISEVIINEAVKNWEVSGFTG